MEELDSMWNFQEDIDKLKLRLQFTTIELDSIKMEANEQKRKHCEEKNHLLNLLNLACKERDEAKEQLHCLISKLIPQPHSENPLTIANSSITESNSLSDPYNHHPPSHACSSPVDSFFDAVTSPDFSAMKFASDSCQMLGFPNQTNVPMAANIDPASAVINGIAKWRTLPQKGKLLQAVMDAGPLLETLIVSGPLPRWRNPPPLAFKIPSVSLKGVCDSKTDHSAVSANPNVGAAQNRVSGSMLNFASSVGAKPSMALVKRPKVSIN